MIAVVLLGRPIGATPRGCPEAVARVAASLAARRPSGADRLLARCPDVPEAALVAGAIAVVSARWDVAAPALERAEQDPALAAVANHLAGVWSIIAGDRVAARKNLRTALELDPRLSPARIGRLVVAARWGSTEEALREAIELARQPGSVRDLADLDLLALEVPVSQALRRVTERLDPTCALCWRVMADLEVLGAEKRAGSASNRRWLRAEAALRRALELAPEDRESRLALGHARTILGQYGAAARVYLEGLELEPSWARWSLLAAVALVRASRPAEALPLAERAAGAGERGAWSIVGRARQAVGRPDARDAFERALESPGDTPRSEDLLALGQELLAAGEVPAARARLEAAAALDPTRRATSYALSMVLRTLGDAQGADRVLDRYRKRLEADQAQIVAEERISNRGASVADALRLLADERVDEAQRRLARWGADPSAPLLQLARAGIALAAGRPPGDLLPMVDAARAANGWLK